MLTIAWDVDDVLNDLTYQWLQSYNSKNNCNFCYKDLTNNPPYNALKTTKKEYLRSLDVFREQKRNTPLQPRAQLIDWFEKKGFQYRHIALTAVPYTFADSSAKWVIEHFGKWIRSFHFVPSHRAFPVIPEYDHSKGAFLKWLGNVDLLVDDSETNIVIAEEEGISSILFPQPWNSSNKDSIAKFLSNFQHTLNNKKDNSS